MRSTFRHHDERPTDDDIDQALAQATIVLDTNVLLSLYRMSPELRETWFEVLRKIDARLFIPYQVAAEFHRNRRDVVGDLAGAYKRAHEAIDQLGKAHQAFGGNGRYAQSAEAVRALVEPAAVKLSADLKALEKDDPHQVDPADDVVLQELDTILEHRIGQRPKAKKTARRVREYLNIRVPLRLPPGYDDTRKIATSGAAGAAGDYLLWCEVLAHARKGDGHDVVLVTEDTKSDWWQRGARGRPTLAHPELVAEFERETGHHYYQLTAHNFLKSATKALTVDVTDDELAEALHIELDATRRSRSLAEAYLSLVSPHPPELDFSGIASLIGLKSVGAEIAAKLSTGALNNILAAQWREAANSWAHSSTNISAITAALAPYRQLHTALDEIESPWKLPAATTAVDAALAAIDEPDD